ncbi:hypothetical protein BFJ66_g11554 [Fusarium oxysporum f. sp. cepae]|uniref:Uncharacterized protein n=2 Tax=Fusarium oxysporum TaxID=5507 RepID=A0A3L6NQ52_FUSOX|nr:hypothetical protein BFJ65_g6950 [Fusarium oxysporum f. sp. cepae]RKK38329.1 hypothetical protein BFJ67_g11933 [Fusarium oxysporum f. sp. cepae]RKK40351.1 hypothetical protein BFJ66_g11554 [Fusarium oxysporum f. sp. cepae]
MGLFEKALGPSAITLRLGKGLFAAVVSKLLFGTRHAKGHISRGDSSYAKLFHGNSSAYIRG